jgi:ferredoxin
MSERLHVDWTRCDGRGLCTELLPELLDRDEWGYPVVRDPRVPRALRRDAQDAVRACPLQALRLLTSSDPSQPVRVTPHSPAGAPGAH